MDTTLPSKAYVGDQAKLEGRPILGGMITGQVAGLLLHQLGPSLLWGIVYGVLASLLKIRTAKSALLLGLGLGVFSMVGPYLFIPILMNALQGEDYWNREVPMLWDWAAHLVFGASFILYPKVLEKLR